MCDSSFLLANGVFSSVNIGYLKIRQCRQAIISKFIAAFFDFLQNPYIRIQIIPHPI